MSLPLIGLVAANAAVSFGSQARGARQEKKYNRMQSELDVAQAQLQAEQQSAELVKQYRETTSYNAALAAMGVGSDTGVRGLMAVNAASVRDDLATIEQQKRFSTLQGQIDQAFGKKSAQTKTISAAQNTGLQSISLAKDLGLFKG